MYKSKNKVNAESNNTLLASLQHLSDFQKDHFKAKETASDVLLVCWNEQAEVCHILIAMHVINICEIMFLHVLEG